MSCTLAHDVTYMYIIIQEVKCDERLLKIRVPTIVRRLPRKLEERAQWKGT